MKPEDILFGKYPRWIGPIQHMVHSRRELLKHIHINSGVRDSFTSLYAFPFPDRSPLIDKAYFEADGDPEKSLKIGHSIFEWCVENNYPTLPNWTGNHSPHIYPLCPNKRLPLSKVSDYLKRFTYHVVQETGQYKKETIKYPDGTKDTVKIPLIDTSVIGDPRRLTRYPETQRASFSGLPLRTFCVTLDPSRFPDMDINEIYDIEKEPNGHNFSYNHNPKKSFDEVDLKSVDLSEWRSADTLKIFNNTVPSVIPKSPFEVLIKKLLPRPCIHQHLIRSDCPEAIRYAAVCELKRNGSKPQFILDIFRQLNWANFDLKETSKQIGFIYAKNTETMGKNKMIQSNFCNPIDCQTCKMCR